MTKYPVQIIAIDLDDTLLKDDLTISDYTVSVLQKAAASGIFVVIASGRTDNAILNYVSRLDIAGFQQGRYIIAQNGASITDLHERKTIFEQHVNPDVLMGAYEMVSKEGLFPEVYDAATIYVPQPNKWTDVDLRLSGLKQGVVKDYSAFLSKGWPKMVIPGEPAHLQIVLKKLRETFEDKAVFFISKPYFLEILPANCGKGEALSWLCQRLGIKQSETMAFGDSMNDESLIRYAHHSVAMINGLDEIKEIAAHVTEKTNDQDGVARFIDKYVL
ncbi:MAG: Cof-type HAD-IIB family hydrolase [Treponemataceae bacterium]|nr:Cof-type HAD-IIB family hydrolase [Treponemataceae bacterium]